MARYIRKDCTKTEPDGKVKRNLFDSIVREIGKKGRIRSGKRLFGSVTFLLIMTLGGTGWAQYPTKPITLLIGL